MYVVVDLAAGDVGGLYLDFADAERAAKAAGKRAQVALLVITERGDVVTNLHGAEFRVGWEDDEMAVLIEEHGIVGIPILPYKREFKALPDARRSVRARPAPRRRRS